MPDHDPPEQLAADVPMDVLVTILADAEPTLLSSVCGLLAGSNLVPAAAHFEAHPEERAVMSFELRAVAGTRIHLLVRKVAQLTSVREVTSHVLNARTPNGSLASF